MWIEEESWILACDDLLTFSVASSILIIIGKMKKKKLQLGSLSMLTHANILVFNDIN